MSLDDVHLLFQSRCHACCYSIVLNASANSGTRAHKVHDIVISSVGLWYY